MYKRLNNVPHGTDLTGLEMRPVLFHFCNIKITTKAQETSLENGDIFRTFFKLRTCQNGPELTYNLEKYLSCNQKYTWCVETVAKPPFQWAYKNLIGHKKNKKSNENLEILCGHFVVMMRPKMNIRNMCISALLGQYCQSKNSFYSYNISDLWIYIFESKSAQHFSTEVLDVTS